VPTLPVAALAAYLAAVLLIGLAWRRRAGRDEASYFLADRSLGTFWGFTGLASLTTGGSTTIALAALVYVHGIAGLWLDLSGALGLAALGLFLARRVRREGAVTLPEIVGRYYGDGARRAAALLVLASEIVWFALLTETTQVVLTTALGLPPRGALLLATAVFVAYTALGGQFAVVRTDLLQYGLMLVGIPGVALACALRGAGGLSGLPPAAWSFPTAPGFGATDVFAMLVLIGLPHMVGSDVYLKLLSCRDEETARKSALLAAGSKLLFGFSVAAIALAARKALPPVSDAAQALPAAVLGFAPPALAALVLVALVATMQTSADVVLLSAAAVTARDLAPAVLRRPMKLSAARLLPVVFGGLGLATALALDRDVLETLKLGYSIFAAGLILPVLAALSPLGRRLPPPGAIAAMFAGGLTAAAGRFAPALVGGHDPVLVGTAVNAAVLAAALGVAGLRGGPREGDSRSREARPDTRRPAPPASG
jgi:SSS family solute:Na+ symporter